MKGSVLHCRCSKCFTVPPKRRVKRRPQPLTLLSLPEDVLLHIMKCLPAADIQSMRQVHPHLKTLVDSHRSVWARACFQDIWPSSENLHLFERAADRGNFEACVKLGFTYLYNEGLSMSEDSLTEINGLKASHFFSLTERLNSGGSPFIWLFIRPPWSGNCCKSLVFDSLKEKCQEDSREEDRVTGTLRRSLQYCLAKVLNLFEDEEKKSEALGLLEASASHGCLHSSFLLWKAKHKSTLSDPGRCLQSLRQLRDYAARGCWEAQISLAKFCGQKTQFSQERATCDLVTQVFQSSLPINKASIFTMQKGMNDTMRYILIDWLVEVATMRHFSSLCLHMTVGLADRYLQLRSVARTRLQLVGIACMVICTRYICKDILTIREAVWVTDNTYKYEDLVRMMGEIVSAVEGKVRLPTVLDYTDILSHIISLDRDTLHLCNYISELSLLHTELSVYSPAQLAAGALLLARILHKKALPWPAQLAERTGFTLERLTPCVLRLHKKCFHDEAPKDNRQKPLKAVKERFKNDFYGNISNEKVMDYGQLCALFGVSLQDGESPLSSFDVTDFDPFLCSPAGNKAKRCRTERLEEDRDSFVTTPVTELSNQKEGLPGDVLDWSLESSTGYEGDRESEIEREGDVSAPSGIVDLSLLQVDHTHCLDSSDDDLTDIEPPPAKKTIFTIPSLKMGAVYSSSYSSINNGGISSSPKGVPLTPKPGLSSSKLVPIPFPKPSSSRFRAIRRPVKRKNQAQHSDDNVTDDL